MKFNPSPETIIHGGDCLIVIGGDEQLKRLETSASTFSAASETACDSSWDHGPRAARLPQPGCQLLHPLRTHTLHSRQGDTVNLSIPTTF